MTKKKSTKRALISSLLVLAMCFTMLAGTTFAWFTDSITAGSNRILAGKLKIDLVKYDGTNYVSIANQAGSIFDSVTDVAQNNPADTLWEPGKTQIVYLGVKNEGNLALKYNIVLDITDKGLADALQFVIVKNAKADSSIQSWDAIKDNAIALPVGRVNAAPHGQLAAPGTSYVNEDNVIIDYSEEYFALAVHMKEDAGNAYQEKDVIIDIAVVATQKNAEADSFGPNYDENAELPQVAGPTYVANATDLAAAITTAQPGDTIALTADITGSTVSLPDGVTILGNGHVLDASITGDKNVKLVNVNSKLVKVNDFTGTLEFDGGTLSTANAGSGYDSDAPFYASTGAGTYIFKDMTVTAGATKGIKISKAKEVVIDGCVFDAGNMDPNAIGVPYDLRSMSMIDIQEQNTADQMKIKITNCTFVGAPQGKLVGGYADTDTAGAIKIKAEGKGFESVEISGNTFTDCYRDVVAGVNVLVNDAETAFVQPHNKSPQLQKSNLNSIATWTISGNTTTASAATVASRGVLIAGTSTTKGFAEKVGEIIGGCAIYNSYKTTKISAGMTVADVVGVINANI